jgi:hypothetical protein
MTNTIQKKFKVSSTQLLYQSCPYQSLTLFLIGPFLDGFLTNQNVFAFNYTSQVVVSGEEALAGLILMLFYSDSDSLFVQCAVFHCIIVFDIGLSKLQHLSCDRKDVSRHLPSPGPS